MAGSDLSHDDALLLIDRLRADLHWLTSHPEYERRDHGSAFYRSVLLGALGLVRLRFANDLARMTHAEPPTRAEVRLWKRVKARLLAAGVPIHAPDPSYIPRFIRAEETP